MDPPSQQVVLALEAAVTFEHALAPRLLRGRPAVAHSKALDLLTALAGLSDDELVALDRRVRPWWWEHGARERRLLRAALGSQDGAIAAAAAAAGSFSPDGYLREAAVKCLLPEPPWSFTLLALRATDWVAQVREAALQSLEPTDTEQLVNHLPVLEQLTGTRVRTSQLRAWLERRLATEDALDALSAARVDRDRLVRRAAWRRLDVARPLAVAQDIGKAMHDPDVAIRLWGLQRLDRLSHPARAALARQLLRDPIGRIKAEGLSILLSDTPSEHDSLAFQSLTDRSTAVRRVAQAHLAARSYDLVELYTDLLRERLTPAIVLGLGESGGSAVLPHLGSLLSEDQPSIRRAALRAISRVAPEQAPHLAVDLLSDESEPVARDAVRILGTKASPAALVVVLQAAGVNDKRPRVRTTALSALRRHRWRWLALALRQLTDEDAGVRASAEQSVALWLSESARVYYGPTKLELELIQGNLGNASDDERRAIEFVIRTANTR